MSFSSNTRASKTDGLMVPISVGPFGTAINSAWLGLYSVGSIQLSDGSTFDGITRHGTSMDVYVTTLPAIAGTVELGATSLAALESVTATGTFWATAANAPESVRLTDGTSFYDARLTRALTAADVVTIAPSAGASMSSQARANQIQLADGTWVDVKTAPVSETTISIGAIIPAAQPTLVAAVTGKRLLVLGFSIAAPSAVSVQFFSNSTQIQSKYTCPAAGTFALSPMVPGEFATEVGEALKATLSIASVLLLAITVGINVRYAEIP